MKLSIIIPVYNVEKYIEECIKSVISQDLNNEEYEVILINDGSVDSSAKICQQLVQKYSNISLYNQVNQGQSVARNYGLKVAKGEYIYFIDSDDYLKPGYFNKFLNILYDEDLDFIGFDCQRTSDRFEDNYNQEELKLSFMGGGLDIIGNYHYNNGPCWYIVKRDTISDLLFEEGRLCEDGIFTTQLLLRVKKGKIFSNKIYQYFINELSTVKTIDVKRLKKINDDMFYAANRFKDIINCINFKLENEKVYLRLKDRQESYTFFAIVRFIKRKKNYSELKNFISELSQGEFPAYPIKIFNGYNSSLNKFLIRLFNNKVLLYLLIKLNQIFNFTKYI